MRLLILGESDSIGMALREPELAWGNRVPAALERLLGHPVETVHLRFYPWTASAPEYLESVLAKGPFDAVVISATKVGFSVYSADNRVRKVLGNRAGDLFKDQANRFDRATRWRQPPGLKRSMNELAHRGVRRVIGQAPMNSMETVAEGYRWAFARLARLEDAQVAVVCAPAIPGFAAKRRPKLTTIVQRFRAIIREECERRRFDFIDPDDLLPPPGPARDAMFTDDVHKAPQFHPLLAERVAEAVAAAQRV